LNPFAHEKKELLPIFLVLIVGAIMIISQYPSAFADTQKITIVQNSAAPGCEKIEPFGLCYSPPRPTINVGDTVTWKNSDSAAHTVTSGTPSRGSDGFFGSGLISASQSYDVTFNREGSFPYFCLVHPWMTGKITVDKNPPQFHTMFLNVSPTTITEGETAKFSGELIASVPISANELTVRYKTGSGLSGSVRVLDDGFFNMNAMWPAGIHETRFYFDSEWGLIASNPATLTVKPKVVSSPPPSPPPSDLPTRVRVSVPAGTSVPGCEETNQCFYPPWVNVAVGGIVTWSNDDTAAHTVTSGHPASGPDGRFDSSLFMAGTSFSTKFSSAGTYDYFCMVHPWMIGTVVAGEGGPPPPIPPPPKPTPVPVEITPPSIKTTPPSIKTTPTPPPVKSSRVTIDIDVAKSSYTKGDIIKIYGTVSKNTGHKIGLVVSSPNGNLIYIDEVGVSWSNKFATQIKTDTSLWTVSGTYSVKVTYGNQYTWDKQVFQFQAINAAPKSTSTSNAILVAGTNFQIPYTITGGSVISAIPDQDANSLKIGISTFSDGELIITLPRSLIDAKIGNADDDFFVLVDGAEVEFSEKTSSAYRNINVPFRNGIETIEIIGTFVVDDQNPYQTYNPPPTNKITQPATTQKILKLNVPIIVFTDKSSYSLGDTLQISGQIKDVLRGFQVTLQIFEPKYGNAVFLAQVEIDKYRKFSVLVPADAPRWGISGEYTVKAIYGTEFRMAQTTFDFTNPEKISNPQTTEKSEFKAFATNTPTTNTQITCDETIIVPSGSMVNPMTEVSVKCDTEIILYKIPSFRYAGQNVVFTGMLTSDGIALSGSTVRISEDDVFWPDQLLGSGITDKNGRFEIPWKVSAGLIEFDFDIYASFDGNSEYRNSRSFNQEMTVTKYSGSLTLNPFQSSAKVGDHVTFTGKLQLDHLNPKGAAVYIKDEDTLNRDDLLATAYVQADGSFSINWQVSQVDKNEEAEIYAVYEATNLQYRLTSCDSGPTFDFGGFCKNTIPLRIYGEGDTPTSPLGPGPSSGGYQFTGSEYMKLGYSLSFSKNPQIAIVLAPDSYEHVKKYVSSVKEGVRVWELELEEKYGGNWNVSFDVVEPGSRFSSEPDVIINLVTKDKEFGCGDTKGWSNMNGIKPISASVCTTEYGNARSTTNVAATSAHEFIHSLGLGHSFYKKGDLMCSSEYVNGKWIPTCPGEIWRSETPTDFNLAAVVALYNSDGYRNPNNPVYPWNYKFTAFDYLNGN